ncbi:MAG: peptidoglycan DD-metalloendopeptidase family protein, partial [Gammaproteobacteria bacterium]|nr:peptidoglycan DD-metalloendopeptidase family protein [Gammaproteobacteria bacterium]
MRSYSGGIRHDYKDFVHGASSKQRRGWSLFVIGLLLPIVGVFLLLVSGPDESTVSEAATIATAVEPVAAFDAPVGERIALNLPPLPEPDAGTALPTSAEVERAALLAEGEAVRLVIERGDSLDRLFRANGLSASDLAEMVAMPDLREHLVRIRPGDEINIIRDNERVLSLSKELNEFQELWVKREDGAFAIETIELEVEIRTVGAHGTIDSSLFEAASAAGLADSVTMELAGIFQWDVDFILDVRQGDSFTVVHEELWRDGEKLRNGAIIAAEFVNRGTSYRAARYVDASGHSDYYTPDGRSVRKAFVRAPIKIEHIRVTSNFNPNRRHPILDTVRAHRGVDYGAPTGTPVIAAGDGTVESRGVNGGYGNAVVLRHGGNITTLYAHLSRFGNYGVGARVRQGDVIGYVGATGQATGPHLHYEYRINGVHRNPRTVELPPAEPVPPQYRADFEEASAALFRQLEL